MFWSYQNQNVHTRTHTFCEVFTRYKDSSLPIQKDIFTDASFGRAFRRRKETTTFEHATFKTFVCSFPSLNLRTFYFHLFILQLQLTHAPLTLFCPHLIQRHESRRDTTHTDICHHHQKNSAWDVCVLNYPMFLYSVQTPSPQQNRQMLSVQHRARSRLDFKQQVLTFLYATQTLLKWFTVQISWRNETMESENR